MRRNDPIFILILLTFLLLSPSKTLLAEGSLQEELQRAALYGKEEKWDFAFLELREILRQYPDGPHVSEVEFSIAEYLFQQGSYSEAWETLKGCLSKFTPASTQFLLARVYLLLCQEKTNVNTPTTKLLLGELKRELSSQKFFVAFDERRTRTWQSPLGIRYTLHEFVDRLEILKNEASFYTISLP